MKIIFFGASKLGYRVCKELVTSGHEVPLIFTTEKTFNIKYKSEQKSVEVTNVLHEDFESLSSNSTSVFKVKNNINEYEDLIRGMDPELIVVVGWYHMIPEAIISIPKHGTIGIHASLLPKYRGNAPLVWAMINGETTTGVSVFYFTDGIDNGDLLQQTPIDINPEDNIAHVLLKAEEAALSSIRETLKDIEGNTVKRQRQIESLASYYPRRKPEDGLIDWTWDAQRIQNFIRAQTKPYPGAYTYIDGKKVIIWDATVLE